MKDFMGDNPVLKINGISLDRLKIALTLSSEDTATGYSIDKDNGRFILYRYTSSDAMIPFPTPLSMNRCAELIWDWLQSSEYPREPDHDGDNKKGWLCYTEGWGHVNHDYRAFIAVEASWIMYGK